MRQNPMRQNEIAVRVGYPFAKKANPHIIIGNKHYPFFTHHHIKAQTKKPTKQEEATQKAITQKMATAEETKMQKVATTQETITQETITQEDISWG